MDISLLFFPLSESDKQLCVMGNMNIHIRTGPKNEYSYNLANLRENWVHKKKITSGALIAFSIGARAIAHACAEDLQICGCGFRFVSF